VNGDHPDRDDLVGFALGALEPGDERAVEAHTPSCARCTRELEALVPAVAVLGESVEQLEPPPELRERVLAIVRSEAEASRERVERPTPPRERRSLRAFLLRPAAALAAVALIAAGVAGYLIRDTGGGGGGETTVAVAPAPVAAGVSGSLEVGDNSSMLDLHGMPQLTGGQVYQVWVAKGSSLRPSSNFVPDSSGRAMTAVDGHLSEGTEVMVTKESGPGHTTPTPPILLRATVE
jgi:anti-sigma-K factor RskA